MSELLKESAMLDTYLHKLCEYCNKYDNIAILNQVKAFVGEENVSLSDVYADFELISKDEYDKGSGKKGFFHSFIGESQTSATSSADIDGFDIDAVLRRLDQKISQLEVEETLREKENHLPDREEDQEKEDHTINGMVVLSEPGGGKTTYLKHLIYELLSCYKNHISDHPIFEKNGLNQSVFYVPFLVRTRDLTDILSNETIEKEKLFDAIIGNSVSNIINTKEEKVISDIFQNPSDGRNLIIIDGSEELNDEKAGKLLECIQYAYESGRLNRKEDRLLISSRYKEYGYQKLVSFCTEHGIEEKYIKFDNRSNAIDECISKWFDVLKKTGQDKQDYFNQMRTTNSDIGRLITTPLELTGLIMLYYSQLALPTDITVLYRSIIEIWLTYGIKDASIPFFSLSDIFLELATIAYYMAESENEKLCISRAKIKEIIKRRRSDLRRYYRSNSYVNAASEEEIDELVDFWLKRNIFVKNSNAEIYEFAHREYQSYLISYAIVNNFIPKDSRKPERIKYFEEHMEKAEDFWDRVIVFSAFMSTDLHDDLIEYVLEKLHTVDAKVGRDEYLLSIILQLANAEGFYFADYEYELLFEELLQQDRIHIMKKSEKGSEIKKLLSGGRKETNTLFLEKAIELLDECNKDIENLKKNGSDVTELESRKNEKNDIINTIGTMVFHIAWNCDANRDAIKKAFGMYLDNWITMDMIYEIKESLASYRYDENRIHLIREIGLEAITRKDMPVTDCYMIISMILGFGHYYEDDKASLYRVALDYFHKAKSCDDETEKLEALIIAINIVYLSIWFLEENEAMRYNCALKDGKGNWNAEVLEEFLACIVNISEYMKVIKGDCVYSRDLYAAYRDLCIVKSPELREKTGPLLFGKEIFRNCLLACENESILKESDETELSYAFEIISLYPLTPDYLNLSEVRSILSKRVKEMEACRKSSKMTSQKAIYLLKLLIFAGTFDENGKVNAVKLGTEIERLRRSYKTIVNQSERSLLDSMENYMRSNAGDERPDYMELMSFMEQKISEM